MQFETSRFGTLEIDEAGIVTFHDGLPGFELNRRFVFIPHRGSDPSKPSPFMWLQSLDDARLAFLITNPRMFFPDYEPVVATADRQALGLDAGDESVSMYALLTVPGGNPSGITANLLAPIVINLETMSGRQVIVNDDRYGLRHRLFAEPVLHAREPEIVSRSMSVTQEYVVHR